MTAISISSAIASALVLTTLLFPHIRKKLYVQIIMNISFCNFMSSLGSACGYAKKGSAGCFWEGVTTNLFPVASVLWTNVIVAILIYIVQYGQVFECNTGVYLICWCIPILATFLPFINSTYDTAYNSGWCFVVPDDPDNKFWIFFWYWCAFYAWIWLGIIAGIIMYVYLESTVRKLSFSDTKTSVKKIYRRLLMYPFIIILCWFIICFNDMYGIFMPPPKYSNVLKMIGNSLACSQGLITSLYYLHMNPELFSAWRAFFKEKRPRADTKNFSIRSGRFRVAPGVDGSGHISIPGLTSSAFMAINSSKANQMSSGSLQSKVAPFDFEVGEFASK